jgi:ankyrin repeat protein
LLNLEAFLSWVFWTEFVLVGPGGCKLAFPGATQTYGAPAVDPNVRDKRGWTPLHSAASAGQAQIIRLLTDAGADVNTFNNEGRSPLVLATDNGHLDSVIALSEGNADVNASDPRGWSPLTTATMANRIEPLRLLLALGANPSNPDAGGWTALIFATAPPDRDRKVIDALLEADADPNVGHVSSGLSPLEAATRSSDTYAVEQLIAYGADPNGLPPSRLPPLYFRDSRTASECCS